MTLLQTYRHFLAAPNPSVLTEGAQINYVPTLTTITEPAAIVKHLAAQAKQLTKKSENVISSFETDANLCAELETTIEFIAGGGALLPGLDDNFLADKVIVFPMIHIVQFDAQRNISQIRLYWDQASLLKMLQVIGSRGRNWPVRDGKDQLDLIVNSASADGLASGTSRRSTQSKHSTDGRSHASSVTSATGDPHATLSLFKAREHLDETPRKYGLGIAPRASAKPPTRNLTDLLAGTEQEPAQPPSPSGRPVSPRKNTNAGAPKGGAGKNYHDIRLFDDQANSMPSPEKSKGGAGKNYHDIRLFDDQANPVPSPEKSVKTHPHKYKHFEFGNGEGVVPPLNAQRAMNQHGSKWSFDDFVTPEKPRTMKLRPNDQRHIGWSDDEDADKSPVFRPIVHHERPDAKPHFAFTDDSDESETQRPTSKHNQSQGLYKDNIHQNDNTPVAPQPKKQPLSTVTNVNHESRHKTFDSQYEMKDDSPAAGRATSTTQPAKADQNRKGLDPSWGIYGESPDPVSKKENVYHIGLEGDGMGGRKGSTRHQWGFDDIQANNSNNNQQNPQSSRTQQAQQAQQAQQPAATSGFNADKHGGGRFWDF